MMDCTHYRRLILAEPRDPSPELREHRESCPVCSQYTDRLLRFESRLDRALRVDIPAQWDSPAHGDPAAQVDTAVALSDRVVPLRAQSSRAPSSASPAYRRGWLAIAASGLLALLVAGAIWLGVPGPSLAADVVTHMGGEPLAWRITGVAVPEPELSAVLRDSHLRLAERAGIVSYSNSCLFRGHYVPHLVIQTESGPVTVMVLVHESVPRPVQFDEAGYRGVIVPAAGHGSLAVLARGPRADLGAVQRIAARVLDSIIWTGDTPRL
jgi:hypothetical protein